MIRRPPRSTLFPTRRSSDLDAEERVRELARLGGFERLRDLGVPDGELGAVRSEEHTSELQSQSNIVCRLLLEKKKIHTSSPVARFPTLHIAIGHMFI